MKDLERKFEFDNNMKILDNYSIDQETPFKSIIKLSQNYLCDLHKSIHSKSFESITSEINFFKEIKQQPLQALIYSSELQIFEARFPKGNKIKQQKYILENMKDVNRYFQNNLEFCEYIKMGLVHFDEFYFTRKYFFEFSSFCSAPFFRDPEFSTSHDFLLAKYFTNYKLLSYMEKRLHKLNDVSLNKIKNSGLKWTSSKVALTELTYALYHGGAVNNGNSDIIEIAKALQQTFNFSLGDLYRTYSEIKSRKNQRAKFLDELSVSLINGMDSMD